MAVSAGQVLIAGEVLRNRFHAEANMIKDRRYHFRTYSSCFVGRDTVDWLVKAKEAQSRENAVRCMRLLQEQGVIHHVCDDHMFKDEYLFYRFRFDDGTFFVEPELMMYQQGINSYQAISTDEGEHITTNVCSGETFYKSIDGKTLVDWLMGNNYALNREDGTVFGQHLMDIGILNQVHNEVVFYDDDILYQFIFDDVSLPSLYEALELKQDDMEYHQALLDDAIKRLGLSSNQKNYMNRLWSNSDGDSVDEDSLSIASSTDGSGGRLKPVVFRQMSAEELTSKGSPYVYKSIRVVGDAVGFGFVVRGDGPCYVQTVDPTGPACRAGLKVRQFVYSVNGKKALLMSHKEIAHEIMQGPMVDLVVLQHFRSKT